MATTTNGIYYPNDYESVADIPADMKKMAESVDTKIAENKTEIDNIKTEQTTQNTNISNLQTDNTTNKQDITEIKAKDTDQDKYIAELEAENSRLREDLNGLPTRPASGESIDLSDSAEMRFPEFKIRGNSKQETRSGKNLLNISSTYTSQGITSIFENGVININGLSSSNWCDINNNLNCSFSSGTYTFSIKEAKSFDVIFRCIYSDDSFKNFVIPAGSKSITISTNDIVKYRVILANLTNGTTYNESIYCQLELGSTATEWEQGGASPSPDYPSEVECCGDNINIFDINVASTWQGNSTTYSVKNNMLNVKGYYFIGIEVPVKKNTDYYLSAIREIVISQNYGGTISVYSADKTAEIHSRDSGNFTFNSGNNNSVYVLFYAGLNQNGECNFSNIKIEEGSTASPYSPYGQGCITEVISNKNLANFEIKKSNLIGINGTYKGSEVTFNGITTQGENITPGSYSGTKIASLKAGTYTISWTTIGTITLNGGATQVTFRNASGKNLATKNLESKNFSKTITIEEDTDIYLQIYVNSSNIVINNYIMKIQIEEGTNTTYYIEHKSQTYTIPVQQPFRSNGDIRDTFIKKDGKRYERHYITRYYLTGNESFSKGSTRKGFYYFETTINDLAGKYDETNRILCNVAKEISASDMYEVASQKDLIGTNSKNIRLMLSNINTVENIKAYLQEQYNAGTPVYVDYISTELLDIECTEEQNAILDQIDNEVKTYKNVTHMYSTDNVSPVIDVTYKQDLETRLNNIEQAILSQGGNI